MSLSNKLYYQIKPFIPRWVQIQVRRRVALRKRARYADVWPIDERAAKPPEGWTGWPDGKQFALVLMHDVDTEIGHQKCLDLMKLDKKLGFRSSFNFVPERYNVSSEVRRILVDNGFEVGVHGLKHDGKLFSSRKIFQEQAVRINHYLKDWKSVGFVSPSMHRNLDWIHDLNVEYDASTFDTDPFEPHPEGVGTIFPFWVAANQNKGFVGGLRLEARTAAPQHHKACRFNTQPSALNTELNDSSLITQHSTLPHRNPEPLPAEASAQEGITRNSQPELSCSELVTRNPEPVTGLQSGYIELPYTLPQDFTLFVIMNGKNIDVWKKKLDWIAQHGGMALLITHPDYMSFNGKRPGLGEYPSEYYEEFLKFIKSQYDTQFWNALPKELASYFKKMDRIKNKRC